MTAVKRRPAPVSALAQFLVVQQKSILTGAGMSDLDAALHVRGDWERTVIDALAAGKPAADVAHDVDYYRAAIALVDEVTSR